MSKQKPYGVQEVGREYSTGEISEQNRKQCGGIDGGKAPDQGEQPTVRPHPDTEPGKYDVTPAGCAKSSKEG
ncbi:hypothetical protein [Photorhabdus kleinii]|uniref:hypothetical protein n=1 Tax=Photorhabdus kleinii TaxID=768034 RepID=UPI0021D50185|nr:hypothetical protein [Photorhabdus kleinii]